MLAYLRNRPPVFWAVLTGVVTLLVVFLIPSPVAELIWMEAVGYEAVFWTILRTKVLLFIVPFVFAAAYLGVNAYVLLRHFPVLQWLNADVESPSILEAGEVRITLGQLRVAAAVLSVLGGLVFAGGFVAHWETFLRFRGDVAFGAVDPIFGKDVSFYLLRVPFYETIQNALSAFSLFTFLIVTAAYVFLGNVTLDRGRLRAPRGVLLHLGLNAAVVLLSWGWGFVLDRYELLYTPGGVVFGASYIDVHFVVPALWGMAAASLALALLALFGALVNRARPILIGLVGYALLGFVLLGILPGTIQQFRVEPNELALETPYIEFNMAGTRQAYALDAIREIDYSARSEVTSAELADYAPTLENVRLWDPRLLIDTYEQIQEIRLYYQFYQVDVDRYQVAGEYRQVMLSARELDATLPERADTWVNRHLQFTHGYGLAMSPVSERADDGSPLLLVRDLPPVTAPGIRIDQPAIYYGEFTPEYRIVDTSIPELDYPQGDENVYTSYDGTGGVAIGSFGRRLLFSWFLGDFNLLLSDYVGPESRLQFWNSLQPRIRRIAPFLQLDQDPYLVIADGELVWIQDAYTTASSFPYAERTGGVNYVRNSVKIVVDAYDGTVDFYVVDPDDPVVAAYARAFPGLFKELGEMPASIRDHLRYPQDLFAIQLDKYARYHMTAPQVFYNNEDLWTTPMEQYGGEQVPMQPYYLLMQLPGEEELQFVLMSPFTPQGRDNMIAWMAARSDQPSYGELVVYKLPKETLIYGPNQVESRIDQDTEISRQLSLWDQRGSRVIRGNLLVIPLAGSFLYVEPVFLIAEGTEIPQLQRVIVVHGESVVMEPTLEAALGRLFLGVMEEETDAPIEGVVAPPLAERRAAPEEIRQAREQLDRAMEALRAGDFATFGAELEGLRALLRQADPTESPAPETNPTPEQ